MGGVRERVTAYATASDNFANIAGGDIKLPSRDMKTALQASSPRRSLASSFDRPGAIGGAIGMHAGTSASYQRQCVKA